MNTMTVRAAEKESLEIDEQIKKLRLRKRELDGFVYNSRAEFRIRRQADFAASLESIKNGETMDSIGRRLGVTASSVSGRSVRLYRYIAAKNGLPMRQDGAALRRMLCDNWELINGVIPPAYVCN